MAKGRTIALNLYDEHVEVLDRLATRQGSRSRAVQRLLEEAGRREVYRELDEAYQEYLKAGEEETRALSEELLPAVSWPQEWLEGKKRGTKRSGRKDRKARRDLSP